MKCIDPGHSYLVDGYDGADPQPIVYMKREGEGYPGNVGHHGGTNCQEVLRSVIDRVKYLQTQIWCNENVIILILLRLAIYVFESRAADRHKRRLPDGLKTETVELEPTCGTCGHIYCEEHKTEPIKVACAIIRDRNGRFLIAKRKDEPKNAASGKWEFPGGKIEPGETPEQTIVREIWEELRVHVAPRRLHWRETVRFAHGTFDLHYYMCDWDASETPTANGCSAFAIVYIHNLTEYDLLPIDSRLAYEFAMRGF